MKTTSTFNLALFLLVILSTFACKGHKSGEDNQTTDTQGLHSVRPETSGR